MKNSNYRSLILTLRYILTITRNGWNNQMKEIFVSGIDLFLKFVRKLHVIFSLQLLLK
jgi:hypothetical protein